MSYLASICPRVNRSQRIGPMKTPLLSVPKVPQRAPRQIGLHQFMIQRDFGPVVAAISSDSHSRPVSTPRFIQHKNEAKAFYAFLSQVYDHIVNPGMYVKF